MTFDLDAERVKSHPFSTELPSQVSISLGNHSGPMLEGQWYTLQCAVQHAAPVEKLQVAFYKGQTRLPFRQPRDGRGLKKPQNETFTLDFTPGREDNGAVFWCEVTLDLDIPEGPPVVTSTNMTALVHCKSQDYNLLLSQLYRCNSNPDLSEKKTVYIYVYIHIYIDR